MIKTMKALIKREFWEHRGAFIKTPIGTGIVLLVITIGVYITGLVISNRTGSDDFISQVLNESSDADPAILEMIWGSQMMGVSTLYLVIMFFVLFFFLLGSLFDDRKDQSILFWKSLPISDSMTVASKILTAVFFVPIAFTAVYFILTIVFMILVSLILLIHGGNPITLVWIPSPIFSATSVMFTGAMVQMLWALPIYGWLTFCSAFSKRRPFLFAVFVPAIVAFSLYWINALSFKFTDFSMFREPLNYLVHAMVPYGSGSMATGSFNFDLNDETSIMFVINNMLNSLANIKILYGAIFAAVAIALAIWVRRYRNTT